ncbi:unnamed protein product [Cylindrotheca closterium]|uniref:Uncharacterized protein n=1 Tax=Cylindrotheca closterium TaxID=2856 RepID=A0AAD2G4Y4_9STRA|nr:unnamed protein product [Cylindrotheca closterium]
MGETKTKDGVPKNGDRGFIRGNADMWESEKLVRKRARTGLRGNKLTAPFVNMYAAVLVFISLLTSVESLVSIGLSVYLTIYAFHQLDDNDALDGSTMSWVLLSFAVITPVSSAISMAFTRRDMALNHMSLIKATIMHIYSAHCCWDWAKAGKAGRDPEYDWLEHCDSVLDSSVQLSHELCRLLTLPSASRARHRVTSWGRREAAKTEKVMTEFHLSVSDHMWNLTELTEQFKIQGLPPNEATRIRQWERMVSEKIEMLLVIKRYRTPQALRSFGRIFTTFLPPFYAPFYGQMAKDLNSLPMAIAFAVITAIALTSLFESITQMEDPFASSVLLDNIDVSRELKKDLKRQLLARRSRHFKDAPPFRPKDSVESHDA